MSGLPGEVWKLTAACQNIPDPDVFFRKYGRTTEAFRYCDICPVTRQCLAYALSMETVDTTYGIWGRTIPEQRSRILRRRVERQKREVS
jgi:hypothetical protein